MGNFQKVEGKRPKELTSSPSLSNRDSFEVGDMKRTKIVYNLWLCHQPVTTFPSLGNAYIHRSNHIPVEFGSTVLAPEQSATLCDGCSSTIRANARRVRLINDISSDAIVLCGYSEPIYEIFMAPKIVYHGVCPCPFGTSIPYVGEIADHDFIHTVLNTFSYEIMDEFVDGIPMSPGSGLVEFGQAFGRVPIIHLFKFGLMFGNSFVPVPPVTQHSVSTINEWPLPAIDDRGNRAFNSNIYIGFGVSTWLINRFSLNGLMGNPILAVVDEFEFSLLTTPAGFSFNTAFEVEWEYYVPTINTITITSEDIDEFEFASISILPVTRGGNFSNMCREFTFDLCPQKSKESPPAISVFPDDLLCGSRANPSFELIVEVFLGPINLTIEETLPTPVIEFIPKSGAPDCSMFNDVGLSELDFESVTSFHIKEAYTDGGI